MKQNQQERFATFNKTCLTDLTPEILLWCRACNVLDHLTPSHELINIWRFNNPVSLATHCGQQVAAESDCSADRESAAVAPHTRASTTGCLGSAHSISNLITSPSNSQSWVSLNWWNPLMLSWVIYSAACVALQGGGVLWRGWACVLLRKLWNKTNRCEAEGLCGQVRTGMKRWLKRERETGRLTARREGIKKKKKHPKSGGFFSLVIYLSASLLFVLLFSISQRDQLQQDGGDGNKNMSIYLTSSLQLLSAAYVRAHQDRISVFFVLVVKNSIVSLFSPMLMWPGSVGVGGGAASSSSSVFERQREVFVAHQMGANFNFFFKGDAEEFLFLLGLVFFPWMENTHRGSCCYQCSVCGERQTQPYLDTSDD